MMKAGNLALSIKILKSLTNTKKKKKKPSHQQDKFSCLQLHKINAANSENRTSKADLRINEALIKTPLNSLNLDVHIRSHEAKNTQRQKHPSSQKHTAQINKPSTVNQNNLQ